MMKHLSWALLPLWFACATARRPMSNQPPQGSMDKEASAMPGRHLRFEGVAACAEAGQCGTEPGENTLRWPRLAKENDGRAVGDETPIPPAWLDVPASWRRAIGPYAASTWTFDGAWLTLTYLSGSCTPSSGHNAGVYTVSASSGTLSLASASDGCVARRSDGGDTWARMNP
jgi:hypothetical protein